jgi:peroxiredoxin
VGLRPDPTTTLALPFGQRLTLGDLRGAPALLVLVPGAFTPVCAAELRDLAEARAALAPARVLVVSCDTAAVLHAWRTSEAADVEVASDSWPHGALARALRSFDESTGWALRRTVLLDDGGRVVWSDLAPGGRARDVREAVRAVARLVARDR